MPYSDKVLDHYNNPRNVGSFDKSDTTVGTGIVGQQGHALHRHALATDLDFAAVHVDEGVVRRGQRLAESGSSGQVKIEVQGLRGVTGDRADVAGRPDVRIHVRDLGDRNPATDEINRFAREHWAGQPWLRDVAASAVERISARPLQAGVKRSSPPM